MPRYRKISPVNAAQRERILKERFQGNKNTPQNPVKRTIRQNNHPLMPLMQIKNNIQRSFENRSTQEVVFDTCRSLRGVCSQVRSFANDLEKLLGSVESVVPVVETVLASYTSSFKSKPPIASQKEVSPKEKEISPDDSEKMTRDNPKETGEKKPQKMPSEEEIKEFLNNPLVASLLQNITQKMMSKKE